jgi:predicted flap endonuclease-1-like 5' DNA nuclease
MKAFKVFVFGLLYGWSIKVAFDRIYRGNEMEDIRNENASLQEYIRTLESKLQSKSLESKSVRQTASQSQPEPSPAQPVQTRSEKDNLKVIKGIGPAIEKKFHNAGIYTFEALARLTNEELENILGSTKRLVQEGNLITQATRLAQQNHS